VVRGAGRRTVGGLLLLVACFLVLATQAQAALYFGTVSIGRANLDGSVLQADFVEPGSGSICAIAVDSSHLYWTDSYDNTIGRANLDGTGVIDSFIQLEQGTLPCGLALDSRFLYWAGMGTDTIGRARLDASEVDPSFIATAQHPCAVGVNQTGIYWTSEDEDEIWRTDIAGVNGPELVLELDGIAADPCGLALNGPHIFWGNAETGTIGRANLDGSEAELEFISGVGYPVSLAIQAGHLYWVNAEGEARSIGRADLDGGGVDRELLGGVRYLYALAADSVVVHPRPPAPAPEPSPLKLGKLRRQPNGAVYVPVDLPVGGWLRAEARGLKVKVLPERRVGGSLVAAGRKWLRLVPGEDGPGRCIVRALRRGDKVRVRLNVLFHAPPMLPTAKNRKLFLFKAQLVRKQASHMATCPA
jgi:hypothetical protein